MSGYAPPGKRRVAFRHHRSMTGQTKDNKQSRSQTPVTNSRSMASSMENLSNTSTDTDYVSSATSQYLLSPPVLQNLAATPTSILQSKTIDECLPFLNGLNNPFLSGFTAFDYNSFGLLSLQRESHVEFLEENLSEFPGAFVGIDASRPWMVYWALLALHLLGEDVTTYRQQVIKTFVPLQNPTGGFGGGQGHLSHLAGTYATILSLALVGGNEAWGLPDRRKMWEWLGRLKQRDGGFTVCEGGEEDVRGAYCALVAISLLELPWDLPEGSPARIAGMTTFGDGLGTYLASCQTYEGGISAAPGNEAHGAYAFCAVACLCLLDRPDRSLHQYLDIEALLSWLSSRQYAPEGGFAGRTNKVVDGCYSHWLGGCWPLILGALNGPKQSAAENETGNLYNTEGLARYILNCCQCPDGGLRDKPSKRPDSYHTCYTLVGISTTETYHYYTNTNEEKRFASAFAWHAVKQRDRPRSQSTQPLSFPNERNFDPDCQLNTVHPVFVIPHKSVLEMRDWALQQDKV